MVLSAPVLVLAAAAVGLADPPLHELFAEYRAFGLPVPPAGCRLRLRHSDGYRAGDSWITETNELYLSSPDRPDRLLTATLREFIDESIPELPTLAPTVGAVVRLPDVEPVGPALIFALQCYALGWDGLARYFYRADVFARTRPPRVALRRNAYLYWYGRVFAADSNRTSVLHRLRSVAEYWPGDDPSVLRDLERALRPGAGAPGTIEALIDGLVDSTGPKASGADTEYDEAYWRVVRRGFDAVPALLDHLTDERLTRGMTAWHGGKAFPVPLRVRNVAGDILRDFAAEDIGIQRSWNHIPSGEPYRREKAEAWFRRAKAVGEERYFRAGVLRPQGTGESKWIEVNRQSLAVLAAKYPAAVADLYRDAVAAHPDLNTEPFARAVLEANLSQKEKGAVLLAAAGRGDRHQRLTAVRALNEIDPGAAADRLVSEMAALPDGASEKDRRVAAWMVAGSAVGSKDPRVWAALAAAATRAEPGVRAEMLESVSYPFPPYYKPGAVRFLLGFFDDAAEFAFDVDFDDRSDRPRYTRLQIRDRAAVALAYVFRESVPVDPKRTAAEWAALRQRLRAAAEAELKK